MPSERMQRISERLTEWMSPMIDRFLHTPKGQRLVVKAMEEDILMYGPIEDWELDEDEEGDDENNNATEYAG